MKVQYFKEDEMRKMMKLFSWMASLALAVAVSPALADTPAAAATPAAPTVTVNGLVDTYISYDLSNSSNGKNGLGNVGYFYNNVDNSFTLGLAEAKFTATQGPASGHLVLAYGQENSLGLVGFGNSGVDVLQAYASYNASQWTFSAGRFVTWMGDEVIESNGNWNYSHSLLFNAIPLWHTGLSVNFAPSSSFGITGYAVDGNNSTAATPDGKEYGLQAVITPNSQWTITLNGEFGPVAGNAVVPNNDGNLVGEGIFTFKPDSMWSFALDAQYGSTSFPSPATPSSTSYWGLALYGRDQISSDYAVAVRLEDVSDNGELGFGQYINGAWVAGSLQEGTLTIEHNFTANLLCRVEGRYDTNSLPTGVGTASAAASIYAGGLANSQVTGTASLVMSY